MPVISKFFEPDSIAIIGSFREGFFGSHVMIKTLREAGFKGDIYPVNPSYREVLGIRVFPSVAAVPAGIDLAFIMVGCDTVPMIIGECASKGVRAVVVVSDGFAERNEKGARLQEEIVDIARRAGIRIIGPNTAGIVNTANGFNPCPYEAGYSKIKEGPVAICSQTGMTNPQAYPYADLGYGISKICDFGNKCDVDECDLLEYLGNDPATGVISMYLESIRNGRRFLETAKRVTPRKPVLVLKSGRTPEGARASASHTGSMAVDDRIFDAACRQAGIIRLEKFSELFEVPKIFALQPPPGGNRLGIVSYTGGVGVLATDEALKYGLAMARLTDDTAETLNSIFPGLGETPVDLGPVAAARAAGFMDLYPRVLEAVSADGNIDCLLNIIWSNSSAGESEEIYLNLYRKLKRNCPKPLVTWLYGSSLANTARLARKLEEMGFPVYSDLEAAVKSLGIACRYRIQVRRKGGNVNDPCAD